MKKVSFGVVTRTTIAANFSIWTGHVYFTTTARPILLAIGSGVALFDVCNPAKEIYCASIQHGLGRLQEESLFWSKRNKFNI
jgi:hypothetical protein